MSYKNRTFKIFNTKYRIKFVDDIEAIKEDTTVFGETDASLKIIKVRLKDPKGKNLSKTDIEQVLIHELMHAIFIEGQYLSCNSDEPLVEWCARCIQQLISQKVI